MESSFLDKGPINDMVWGKIHKIKIPVDLSPLLPYFTPMSALHRYENGDWDELIQKEREKQTHKRKRTIQNVTDILTL